MNVKSSTASSVDVSEVLKCCTFTCIDTEVKGEKNR